MPSVENIEELETPTSVWTTGQCGERYIAYNLRRPKEREELEEYETGDFGRGARSSGAACYLRWSQHTPRTGQKVNRHGFPGVNNVYLSSPCQVFKRRQGRRVLYARRDGSEREPPIDGSSSELPSSY